MPWLDRVLHTHRVLDPSCLPWIEIEMFPFAETLQTQEKPHSEPILSASPPLVETTPYPVSDTRHYREYAAVRVLSKTPRATVKLMRHRPSGHLVVFKCQRKKNEIEISKLKHEASMHSRCHHRHIAKLLTTFDLEHEFILVVEYCSEGTLGEVLQRHRNTGANVARLANSSFYQLVCAVSFLHEHDVAHGDLKLENVGVDQHGSIKLFDFGCADALSSLDQQTVQGRTMWRVKGTPLFMAPELCDMQPNGHVNAEFDLRAVDCYALGVIAVLLHTGELPLFLCHKQNIGATSIPVSCPSEKLAQSLRNIALQLLCLDPVERMTSGSLVYELQKNLPEYERGLVRSAQFQAKDVSLWCEDGKEEDGQPASPKKGRSTREHERKSRG